MPTFNLKDFRTYSPIYVETGSCEGESINRALNAGFNRIKSVEYHEPFYRHCIQRFKGKNVELFLGKSTDQLERMLADVYEPAVIFLDAHPAGPHTGGHKELMGGDPEFLQDTILKNELKIILDHRKDHIIIIDDQVRGAESDYYKAFISQFNTYRFEFFDEQLETTFTKEKILVCEPF